jgi:hypothetical protein
MPTLLLYNTEPTKAHHFTVTMIVANTIPMRNQITHTKYYATNSRNN